MAQWSCDYVVCGIRSRVSQGKRVSVEIPDLAQPPRPDPGKHGAATCKTDLARLLEVSCEFSQLVYMYFVHLEKAFDRFHRVFCRGCYRCMGCQTQCNGPSGPCRPAVGVVLVLSGIIQTRSSTRAAVDQSSCL